MFLDMLVGVFSIYFILLYLVDDYINKVYQRKLGMARIKEFMIRRKSNDIVRMVACGKHANVI
jgi:hypothetical protein